MRITQGAFSFLPDLTDEEIKAQIDYCQRQGWAIAVEFTDDPHPRNVYWEMWGLPAFDMNDPAAMLYEVNKCREAFPNQYIKVVAYDPSRGRQTTGLDFLVQRPAHEPGFQLLRQEAHDRVVNYTVAPYAAQKPHGERYSNGR